jgi:hypothetical protein
MNYKYFHSFLSEYLANEKPMVIETFSETELLDFIQKRGELAEAEFEVQRRAGNDIPIAQEMAHKVLFVGLISEDERFLRDFIEKYASISFETMAEDNRLNQLITKLMPFYLELLTDNKIPTELKKYELKTKIDNLILSNGF